MSSSRARWGDAVEARLAYANVPSFLRVSAVSVCGFVLCVQSCVSSARIVLASLGCGWAGAVCMNSAQHSMAVSRLIGVSSLVSCSVVRECRESCKYTVSG